MAALVVLMACVVSAQFPPGWNYNPYLYYPYTAQQLPVQETPEVAAARSAHLAIHALAKASKPVAAQPTPIVAQPTAIAGHPGAISVTSNAWAGQANHQGPASASAFVTTSAVPQQVQETAEVAAARRAHMAAHALAAARVVKVTPAPTALASQQLANSVTATTNAMISSLPSFLSVANWGPPQPVQDTPEVQAAKLAFFRAFREAFFRFG